MGRWRTLAAGELSGGEFMGYEDLAPLGVNFPLPPLPLTLLRINLAANRDECKAWLI